MAAKIKVILLIIDCIVQCFLILIHFIGTQGTPLLQILLYLLASYHRMRQPNFSAIPTPAMQWNDDTIPFSLSLSRRQSQMYSYLKYAATWLKRQKEEWGIFFFFSFSSRSVLCIWCFAPSSLLQSHVILHRKHERWGRAENEQQKPDQKNY